jgi:hypothetical protein
MEGAQTQASYVALKDNDLEMLCHILHLNIKLRCNSDITDDGLFQLIGLNIQSLSLNGCKNLTDAGLAHLRQLPITTLTLRSCTEITNNGVAHLSELPLKHLVIDDCGNVSDEGLDHLNQLPLQKLEVIDCPLITHGVLPLFGNFHTEYTQLYKPCIMPVYWISNENNDLVRLKQIVLFNFRLECGPEITPHGLRKLLARLYVFV